MKDWERMTPIPYIRCVLLDPSGPCLRTQCMEFTLILPKQQVSSQEDAENTLNVMNTFRSGGTAILVCNPDAVSGEKLKDGWN